MRRQQGFTLIELMIVVAVIAVLAAIAIPNYLEQTRKGRRAEASRSIGQLQLELERWRAENPSYANCAGVGCGSGTYPTVPTSDYYTIAMSSVTATGYTITATPKGKQTGDRCANLGATNLAKPTWTGDSDCNS
jgi:type IV pilus assembly protein PilE